MGEGRIDPDTLEVNWGNSPPGTQGKWSAILDGCRENPGTWCDIGPLPQKTAYNLASRINRGAVAGADRPDEFEATSNVMDDGTYRVWIRYPDRAER